MEYLIHRAGQTPRLNGDWGGAGWGGAEVVSVNAFHPASLDHRPLTETKVVYDDAGIYVMFRVRDRFVRCTRTEHQSITSRDSCVEAYLQPKADRGYFNFEMNCGGAALMMYITDPTRVRPGIFKEKEFLPPAVMGRMRIYHSLPKLIPIEISEPVEWTAAYFIPNAVFERYVGPLGEPEERRWRGNFFKCADESSHPHWASWNPLGETLNFHDPATFAPIRFEA